MRGKKFDFIPEDANEFLEENTSDKRTPATGFLGMRGKKQKLVNNFGRIVRTVCFNLT